MSFFLRVPNYIFSIMYPETLFEFVRPEYQPKVGFSVQTWRQVLKQAGALFPGAFPQRAVEQLRESSGRQRRHLVRLH